MEVGAEFQQFAGLTATSAGRGARFLRHDKAGRRDLREAMKLTKGSITAEAPAAGARRLLRPNASTPSTSPACPTNAARSSPAVLVIEAAFSALDLQRLMAVSKAAMREGILYDMLGRGSDNDPREARSRRR